MRTGTTSVQRLNGRRRRRGGSAEASWTHFSKDDQEQPEGQAHPHGGPCPSQTRVQCAPIEALQGFGHKLLICRPSPKDTIFAEHYVMASVASVSSPAPVLRDVSLD